MSPRLSIALALSLAWAACSDGKHDGPLPDTSRSDASRGVGMDASASGDLFGNVPRQVIDASAEDANADVDASWHGAVPEVCDGSPSIRLRYLVDVGAGNPAPGEGALIQNGYAYWLITGECHFYAQFGPGPWWEVHDGDLTAEEAQEVGRRVHFGEALEMTLHQPEGTVSDAGTEILELGGLTVGCYANCSAVPAVKDAYAQARAIGVELAASGKLWEGPIRISSMERGGPSTYAAGEFGIPWPLSAAPELVSVPEENLATYMGVLIENPIDLAVLRALKTNPNARSAMTTYGYVQFQDSDTTHYEFRFRDAIPLENKDGFIERTWAIPTDASDGGL